MTIERKVDLPPVYEITAAANRAYTLLPTGRKAVYLVGHGAHRDWHGGVAEIFNEYLDGLVPVFVPQDDNEVEEGGYRPILKRPNELRVRGATSGIIFDTSAKEYTLVDGVFIPTSTSNSGQWIDFLRLADYLDIPTLASIVTWDEIGVSTVPIHSDYKTKGRVYTGPKRFVMLNSIPIEVAARMQQNNRTTEEVENFIKNGRIIPDRLRQYETYLRKAGLYLSDEHLENVLMGNLNRITELDLGSFLHPDEWSTPLVRVGVLGDRR
ncbi:MAG: hypothetical protein HYW23_03460 [Candidatus Aenigmarchaeota archaeon]|nr:hypothetical protein [Candidatus Aenigmarchaeota archaeon]